ncbi:MAG TPA: helix-turn-helix domain-containing protein [Polyangia bacterium]
MTVDDEERKRIEEALSRCNGSKFRVAKMLGLDRWYNKPRMPGIAAMAAWFWRQFAPNNPQARFRPTRPPRRQAKP